MSDYDNERISQADRIIDSVCQSSKVTAEGKKWLKLALDPFPDETRTCGGFPDMISSKSNVYPLQVTTTISGAAYASPWDCHIAFNGQMTSTPLRTTAVTGNRFSASGQSATAYDFGGLQVRTALTGTQLTGQTTTSNLFAPVPQDRPWRILSGGVETHNMTEPLYRSGKVLTYRQPTVPVERTTVGCLDAAGTSVSPASGFRIQNLPETLGQVQNIPDTTNWDAEEGAYIVFAMDGPTNEPNAVLGGNGYTCPFTADSTANYFPLISGASPLQSPGTIPNSKVPFNNCGIYFADLSPQTKIDIVWHLIVEAFPPSNDFTLTALSTPSAQYDPEALVLYSKALRSLPVGVRVAENGLGTFFFEAAKSIAKWAAPKLLKGLDPEEEKEDKELLKIRTELDILRELSMRQNAMKQPTQPRKIEVPISGHPKITTGGTVVAPRPRITPTPPPKPARDNRPALKSVSRQNPNGNAPRSLAKKNSPGY